MKKINAPKPQRRDNATARVIRRLEEDKGHGVSLEEWGELLAGDDPEGYGDLPLPGTPTWVPAGPGRVKVYTARAARVESIFHPADTKLIEDAFDHIALLLIMGKKQGGLCIEGMEEENDGDDDCWLEIPTGRKCARPERPRKTRA